MYPPFKLYVDDDGRIKGMIVMGKINCSMIFLYDTFDIFKVPLWLFSIFINKIPFEYFIDK